ncbi:hypothetical protein U1Q18_027959 [Sarracenia purpurea var. burkii]
MESEGTYRLVEEANKNFGRIWSIQSEPKKILNLKSFLVCCDGTSQSESTQKMEENGRKCLKL